MKDMRCVICRAEFTNAEIEAQPPEKQGACPNCGNRGLPEAPKDDVQITINWHSLRILCIWAERWAHQCKESGSDPNSARMPEAVYAIARDLQKQHPSRTPVTLSGEIAQLKDAFPKVETTLPMSGDECPPEKIN